MCENFSLNGKEYFLNRQSLFVESNNRASQNDSFSIEISLRGAGTKYETLIDEINSHLVLKEPEISLVLLVNCDIKEEIEYKPNIIYLQWDFFMRNRFRSSIYWTGSGKPCPKCCLSLWEEQGFISNSKIYKIGKMLNSDNNMAKPGVRLPDQLEILSVLADARRIAAGIKAGNQSVLDDVQKSEVYDLVTGKIRSEKFPVDLLCECW